MSVYNTRSTQPFSPPFAAADSTATGTSATNPFGVGLAGAGVDGDGSAELVPVNAQKLPNGYVYPAGIASPRPQQQDSWAIAKHFVYVWQTFMILLVATAGADLGVSIYINFNIGSVYGATVSTKNNAYTVYSVKYLDGETLWCALFFAAQAFTILAGVSIVLLLPGYINLKCAAPLWASSGGVTKLTFGILLLSFVGLALYALPISKWTYIITTNYSFDIALPGSPFPTAAFALSWGAVLFWLVVLILAAVELINQFRR